MSVWIWLSWAPMREKITIEATWPFQSLALLGGGYRLWGGLFRIRRLKRLRARPKSFLKLETLISGELMRDREVFMGRGFSWGRETTQQAIDFQRNGRTGLKGNTSGIKGWIHGMHASESPLRLPLQALDGHLLLVGTTGSGKTRLFELLIAQAIARHECVIIVDPKGDRDLMETARATCLALGHPDRFVYFHPGFPESSVRINPLRNFNRASELASRIAGILPSQGPQDPFKAFSQKALDNVVQGLLLLGVRPSLNRLRVTLERGPSALIVEILEAHFIAQGHADFDQSIGPLKRKGSDARAKALIHYYHTHIMATHPLPSIDGLLSLFEHDRIHFGKMIASLLPLMNMLTTGTLGPLLSPEIKPLREDQPQTHLGRIIRKAQVFYCGLDSLSDASVGSALGSILLADLASIAGDRYNYESHPKPINVFVDEAAEVVNDPCIQLLNKGRGSKIRMTLATQTFADFSARTGSEAKARQILGNLNTLVSLRIQDAETQRYIAESFPKVRIHTLMRTQGTATLSQNPAFYTGNIGERLIEEEVDLVPAALLGQLPDLEYFVRLPSGEVYKGRLPILEHHG